jgi:hypothetical protein
MLLLRYCAVVLLLAGSGLAAPKEHAVVLGKWRTVKAQADSGESGEVKIRKLLVDGRAVENTSGTPHDVTDRVFVIRRVYQINDALPGAHDDASPPQWAWRLGGWISVDRLTGHIAQLNLPSFDPEVTQASWYRDYAAYCGISEDGAKTYLVVWQLGRRKPILNKETSGPGCAPPHWERAPSRVTFIVAGEKASFTIRARGADPQAESKEEEGPQ